MNFAEENVSGSDYSEHGEAFQIFNSELLKIKKYFEETQNLGIKKDRELVQTHCELVIIALHIYLEEYLKNVIKYASENDDAIHSFAYAIPPSKHQAGTGEAGNTSPTFRHALTSSECYGPSVSAIHATEKW